MRAQILCAGLVAVIWSPAAGAQTVALSEAEALSRLSADHPRVVAARAGIDVARADVLAAGRWPNPRVTYNRESVAGINENMVMVTQPLPVSGRRQLEVRAATARADAVSSRADEAVRRLRADLRLAFTDLWVAQTREQELARTRERAATLAELLGRREAAGESAGFDRLRADRELIEIDADRASAGADRSRAQSLLGGFINVAPAGLLVASPGARTGALPTVDELMARAEMARGDFIALKHDVDAAMLAGEAAARRRIPEPEVVGGTKSSNAGSGDVGSIISVHVAVPLFDRGQPERAAATAHVHQARAEAEALRTTVRAQIAALRASVDERRQAAARYRAAVSANAGDIERIAQVSYDAGERGILELLDAYRVSSAARVRQTMLDAAVREAEIELEYVSGWEMP
jgi:cobalt-zinc-cadmium efflux system outer membrane protein